MRNTIPRVSVVICTHNRARDLERALESLAHQVGATFPWEIIVVDNASTDHTPLVVARWKHELPVGRVVESRPGLCHARNTGWQNARSDVIAYLDDDALADPDWLTVIRARFDERDATLGCIGGKVDPIWEAPRPAWLSDQVAAGLTIVNWSDRTRTITDLQEVWLVGANIAFRRDALVASGGFHPALDRSGTRLLSSGDVYLTKRILELGYECEYHPAMRVRHRVPGNRLTQQWFRRRFFWQGVSNAIMETLDMNGARLARLRRAIQHGARLAKKPRDLVSVFERTEDPAAFQKQCWTLVELGRLARLVGVA